MEYQKTPWKINFNPTGAGPYVFLVRLLDLITGDFFGIPAKEIEKLNNKSINNYFFPTSERVIGFKPPHDVFAFSPIIYDTGGKFLQTLPDPSLEKLKIEICKVRYSENSPKRFVEKDNYVTRNNEGIPGYYIHDPESALLPVESDFIPINKEPSNLEDLITATSVEFSTGWDLLDTQILESRDVILTGKDTTIENLLKNINPTLLSTYIPYTRIYFNTHITELVAFYSGYYGGINNGEIVALPLSTYGNSVLSLETNPALMYTYVWVKCSWFADYINELNYSQDLNMNSNVIHKNIIIGNYSEKYLNDDPQLQPYPYIPYITPRVVIDKRVEPNYNHSSDENIKKYSIFIKQDADKELNNFFDVAEFPIPLRKLLNQNNYPIGWFNPDISFETQVRNYLRLPAKGNIYASGRIFSPTIDEIWYQLKLLIDGRPKDEKTKPILKRAISYNEEYPYEQDVLLPNAPEFDLPNNKKGDPLNKSGSLFVNNANYIRIQISKNWAEIINKFFTLELTNLNILNKCTPFDLIEETQNPTRLSLTSNFDIILQTNTSDFALRQNPLSIREIETYLKGFEFNTITTLSVISQTTVKEGGLDNLGVGTLYKLHKNYKSLTNNTDTDWVNSSYTTLTTETFEYGDYLPTTNGEYNRFQNQLKEDIYLAADGSWRYLFDTVRIPILDEPF